MQALGVAHYRADDYSDAVLALNKSLELSQGREAVNRLFLATWLAQRSVPGILQPKVVQPLVRLRVQCPAARAESNLLSMKGID